MLAAKSANQGSSVTFEQNQVPKPRSQNRQFAVTHGSTLIVIHLNALRCIGMCCLDVRERIRYAPNLDLSILVVRWARLVPFLIFGVNNPCSGSKNVP